MWSTKTKNEHLKQAKDIKKPHKQSPGSQIIPPISIKYLKISDQMKIR